MASGFFLGGLSQGFESALTDQSAIQYRQGVLQLEQQRMQQQQQNQQRSEYMQLYSNAISHLGDTITAIKNKDPSLTELQIASNPGVISLKNMINGFGKNLNLGDNSADPYIASMAAGPSQVQTKHAEAVATGSYGKEQAQTNEANARTRVLNQAADQNAPPPSNPDLDTDTQLGGKQFKSSGNARVDNIIKGVDNGDLPPVVSGNVSYKDRTAFASGIEANGINLAQKQLQWKQAEKQVQSLNGPQMVRYVGLNKSVQNTIDEALNLSKQMQLSGIPALNALELKKYIQTQGNSPQGQLATQYVGVINTLKEEFAQLANGGYAPTDPAWKLADEQINGNYGWQQLPATLLETKKLVNIRLHAIPGMDTLGPGAKNQYTGGSPAQFDNDFKPVPGFPGVTVRQVQ